MIALAALAVVAIRAGDVVRAGRIWGAIETEERRSFLGWWSTYRGRYDEVANARPGPVFDEARAAGREVALDDMIEEALARPVAVG